MVPDFQTIFLPLLKLAGDGEPHSLRDAYDMLAQAFRLSEAERRQLLPSGRQTMFENRVGWARTYLAKAGLFSKPRRGYFQITDRGQQLLAEGPQSLNIAALKRYPEFTEFHEAKREGTAEEIEPPSVPANGANPEEALESAHQALRASLAKELLATVKAASPEFFERLVIDLLVRMGYGGSRREAGSAIGGTGDGGIDGIIKEDRLGLDVIYVQAKPWDGKVGLPEIQKFAGALQGKRAKKGIFITTSDYSDDAREYASLIETKIILIDGDELGDLMIDHNVGVASVATYELKRIDHDYFDET